MNNITSLCEQTLEHDKSLAKDIWERGLPIRFWLEFCRNLPPRSIPHYDEPLVSIVIPVFNKWELTIACVNSIIVCTGDDTPYEIILVDDCSIDATLTAADSFPGLRIIRMPDNSGFIRACNKGAQEGKGQYILLLNNDTVVTPHWLSALCSLLQSDDQAAIAGPTMYNPDGKIVDSGATIYNDGTGERYPEPYAAHLNFVREVDYIIGACMLIRGTVWKEIGGLDERYGRGYYEECDFAMNTRAHGYRVVYQPMSKIIHHEHATFGEYAFLVMDHNRLFLLEKWRQKLADEHCPPATEAFAALANACRSPLPAAIQRRREGKLNILYYSPWPSHPVKHGNMSTMANYGAYFQSLGHKVYFAMPVNNAMPDQVKAMQAAWDTLDLVAAQTMSAPPISIEAGIPWDAWYDEGLGEDILALCGKYDIDMVFCSYVFQSKLLEYVPNHILKVIDTHDRMGGRFKMLLQHDMPIHFFSTWPETEGGYLRRADLVIARRNEERTYFNHVIGADTAITIGHLEHPHFIERRYETLHNVGIVASQNHINLMFIIDFIRATETCLNGEPCPFQLNIAGNVALFYDTLTMEQKRLFDLPFVRRFGFVDDIEAFYAAQDLMAIPITTGTGINIKTIQALAFGMPFVTTRCGNKGVDSTEPLHQHDDTRLEDIVRSILYLQKTPHELTRLAALSRTLFTHYQEEVRSGMRQLFAHPKLNV